MGNKDQAIQELQRQMAKAREELGPERVKELKKMMQGNQSIKDSDLVAYDKETAMKALEIFIQNHGDPEWLRQQILNKVSQD